MKRLIPVVAAACLLLVQGQVHAVHSQEPIPPWSSAGVASQRISMGVGKSKIVELPQDAAEIFVANPRVANAVMRSPRRLYIIGMDAGQTSVYAMDMQGRQIAALELSIGRDIGELQQILRAAMPSVAIIARTVNDTIILTNWSVSAPFHLRAAKFSKSSEGCAATSSF